MPDLASFGWRKRGGQPAFRLARKAETREDWPTVVTTCRQALTADPGHLEAAWLLAVGLGKLGKPAEVVAPLEQAVAGDFGKWGNAALELPALQPFLGSPTGEAWKRRLEQDRSAYLAALARSTIVTAAGDLYAYDAETTRWYRLTRTDGAVIGALGNPAAHQIAYVTRAGKQGKRQLGIGVLDLARGRTLRAVDLATPGPLQIAYSAKAPVGFWIGIGVPRATSWRVLDADNHLHPLPAKAPRPAGVWLEVVGKTATLHALPGANVSADWDDHGLASAMRLGSSHRVVSAPSPGLIDGNTVAWSPDRSRLAFVAQLDDHCTPGTLSAAAFIADAATGNVQELERAASGLAVEWLTDRKLAVAGDHGVTILDLDGTPPLIVDGATGLVCARHQPSCTELPDPDDEPTIVDDRETPEEPAVPVGPTDAGVDAAR